VDLTYIQDLLKTDISFASVRIRNKALGRPVPSLDTIQDEGFQFCSIFVTYIPVILDMVDIFFCAVFRRY